MSSAWLQSPLQEIYRVVSTEQNDTGSYLSKIYESFKENVTHEEIPELLNKYSPEFDNKLVKFRGLVSDRVGDEIYDLSYHPENKNNENVENIDTFQHVETSHVMRDIYAVKVVPFTKKFEKQQLDPSENLVVKVCRVENAGDAKNDDSEHDELKIAQVYDFFGVFDASTQSIGVIHHLEVKTLINLPTEITTPNLSKTYKNLHSILTKIFYNDKVASEYCLLSLLSTVYSRADPLPLGRMSVNFGNIPDKDFGENFVEFLRKVISCVGYVPMDLESLNDNEGYHSPSKSFSDDFDENDYLKSGLFQAMDGTVFVMDETKMEAGKLEAQGMTSLKNFRNLTMWQQLSYDFKYFQQDFPVNFRFFLISDGKVKIRPSGNDVQKQLLALDTPVNVRRTEEEIAVPWQEAFETENLEEIKTFIEYVRIANLGTKSSNTVLSVAETKELEDLWVENRPLFVIDDLHRLMAMARVLKICFGEDFSVKKVVALEKCRLAGEVEEIVEDGLEREMEKLD
jgi:hypothetical protein